MSVAAVRAEDAAAIARLLASINPDRIYTAAGVAHLLASRPERARFRGWTASAGGELVGWATAALEVDSIEPSLAFATVAVDAAHRRRGLGGALWEAAAAHVTEIAATRVTAQTLDTRPSRRFAEAHGFREERRKLVVSLDPRTLPPAPEPPPGVEVRPLAAYDDDPRPIHRVDLEASADVPGEELDEVPYDDWLRIHWQHPDFDSELSHALSLDGEVVAISFVRSDRQHHRAMNDITGTLRAHRGQGYARLVKHTALRRAAAAGITSVVTENDELNAPMRAVNRRLGYRPLATRITWST